MSKPKQLIDPTLIAASTTTYYTVPANFETTITQFTLHNTTLTPVTVTIYCVPPSGTAGADNEIFQGGLSALETKVIYGLLNGSLKAAATIQLVATTASAVSLHLSGREVA